MKWENVTDYPLTMGEEQQGTVGILVKGKDTLWRRVPDGYRKASRFDKLLLLLSLIIHDSALRRQDWIPVSSGFLYDAFGDGAQGWLLPVLVNAGAIYRESWCYSNRRKLRPIRCRLSAEFSALPVETVPISVLPWLRYRNHRAKRRDEAIAASPVHRDLWADLQLLSLHPDYQAVIPEFGPDEWRREFAWLRTIEQIESKDIDFPPPGSGRVYTTFSSTPSLLRRYALVDGQPLVEIDVKCCQPFLHGTLLPRCGEKERYMASVLSGRFYEEIGQAGGWDGGDVDGGRERLKEEVFRQVFYGRTRPAESFPIWGAFTELYPALAEVITYRKRPDHCSLAVAMQNLEAKIIIHGAVPAIRAVVPGVRILTVHDALYLHADYVQAARAILAETFRKSTGYAPTLRVTPSAVVAHEAVS